MGICLLCKRTSEIAALVISICVAVYLAFRNCKGRHRADPKSPSEGPAVTIEMEQMTQRICPREPNVNSVLPTALLI